VIDAVISFTNSANVTLAPNYNVSSEKPVRQVIR
jgi:hypothetical protein